MAGATDFGAYRSDVIFLCITYAAVGLVLARLAFGLDMLPMLFPLASGFILLALGQHDRVFSNKPGKKKEYRHEKTRNHGLCIAGPA